MVLAGVVPELAYYGLLGAYFTHTIGFPFTLLALLWFYNTTIAVHRNDPFETAELVTLLNFTTPSVFPLGVALGLLYVWALRLAPLLPWELWRVRRRRIVGNLDRAAPRSYADIVFYYQGSVTVAALAAALAAAGANFLRGKFEPEVSSGASTAIGIAALVIGVLLVVFVLARLALSPLPHERLDFGFTVALILYMLLPATYDYLVPYRPAQQFAFQISLFLVTLAVTAAHVRYARRLATDVDAQLALRNDPRAAPSQLRTWHIVTRWFTLWALAALIYLTGGITDDATAVFVEEKQMRIGDVVSVAIVVFVTVLILLAIGALLGACLWRWSPRSAAARVDQWRWDTSGEGMTVLASDDDYELRVGAQQRPGGRNSGARQRNSKAQADATAAALEARVNAVMLKAS